jgi:hypothetical protein
MALFETSYVEKIVSIHELLTDRVSNLYYVV